MRNGVRTSLILLVIVAIAIPGLLRLRFATDILGVLPNGVPEVEALQVFREHFDDDQQVIVLLKHEEEVFEEDAAALTQHLREKLPQARVEYRSQFEDNPGAFAESLARMWADAGEEEVAQLTASLTDEAALIELLQESKSKIELSLDQKEATMAAYDPLGFLNHPAMRDLQENEFSYQSDDGKYWILLISNSNIEPDYHEHSLWVNQIRDSIDSWEGEGYSYTLTGGPVYSAEVGLGMEKDMSGTIMATSILVGLLFLLIQRSPVHLLILSGILALVFLITMGAAGWIFGTLNLVSVGFAAILLGLVIDYGVVIARESHRGDSASISRRALAPGILWAALTTAAVFGLLIFSTFTGVSQLGSLIAIGLCVGAVVCLWIMPWAMEKFPAREASSLTRPLFPKAFPAKALLASATLASLGIFAFKGFPRVSFNFSMVQPESSEASQTFEKIQTLFTAWSKKNVAVIVQGETADEVRNSLKFARAQIEELEAEGVIEGFELPLSLVPDPKARARNKAKWQAVGARTEDIVETMEAQGFTESGRALGQSVLKALAAGPGEIDPMTKMFYHPDGYFSGRVRLVDDMTAENLEKLQVLNQHGVRVTGWEALQYIMLPMVKRDFYYLCLPATGVLLLALGLVFRSVRDTLLTASVLLAVLLMVNAISVATGRPWNFLSGMAIPLIVGTGIDYSIHLIYSLRRSQGNLAQVWNGVGKAICFCGLSTAVGFGSLIFASNEMLQSMGLFCCAGVLLTMTFSLLVIPGIWVATQKHS
ncbi:MMPL family transporter [Verrucomicrobiaceae bacterium 227]